MRGPTLRRERDGSTIASGQPFPSARLLRIAEIERTHFWFVARRLLVELLLKNAARDGFGRVLDVGCGTGANAVAFRSHARCVVGLDRRPEGLRSRQGDGARFVRGDATRLPFANASFDAVTALDVLEHVADDAALTEIRRVLRPGGALVVSVPAMPWLWSYRDIAAGHLRRYRRRGLIDLLRTSGFELYRLEFYQCLLFPLVLARAVRRNSAALRDLEEQPAPVLNALLTWIGRAEIRAGRHIRWPFGSSLVALCRKPHA